MNMIFDRAVHLTSNIWTFWFTTESPLDYSAGQFVEVRLPHDNADDRGDKRWFTLSSSPTESGISITTRIPRQCSTFKQALTKLQKGNTVAVSDAMGDFVLPLDQSLPLLFIAVGIGITPFLSMLTWLADTGQIRRITLIHAGSDKDSPEFAGRLEHLNVSLHTIRDPRLHLHADTIEKIANQLGDTTYVYLAGPEAFVENIVHDLEHSTIKPSRIVTDYFPGYANLI